MQQTIFDRILKLGVVILAIIFLVFYWQSTEVGRYQMVGIQDHQWVLDTKTGDVYWSPFGSAKAWIQMASVKTAIPHAQESK